jgi:hypothetical protein
MGGLDILLALEWMKAEVALLEFSIKLENILEGQMEKYIKIVKRKDVNEQQRLPKWMRSQFKVRQQKRLVIEMGQAKARMLEAWEAGASRAEKWGQSWTRPPMDIERIEYVNFKLYINNAGTVWQEGYRLIAEAWAKLIQDERSSEKARSELLQLRAGAKRT